MPRSNIFLKPWNLHEKGTDMRLAGDEASNRGKIKAINARSHCLDLTIREKVMGVNQCLKKVLMMLIVFYRNMISPFLRPSCRYYPSCSLYALTLFELTHPFNALFFSIIRVFKCNPWAKGGYDYPTMKVKISKLEYQPIKICYWFVPLKPLKIPICIKKPIQFRAYILLKD